MPSCDGSPCHACACACDSSLERENDDLREENRDLRARLRNLESKLELEVQTRAAQIVREQMPAIEAQAEKDARERLKTEIRPEVAAEEREKIKTEIRPEVKREVKETLMKTFFGPDF